MALLTILRDIGIDLQEVASELARAHPRRMKLDMINEEGCAQSRNIARSPRVERDSNGQRMDGLLNENGERRGNTSKLIPLLYEDIATDTGTFHIKPKPSEISAKTSCVFISHRIQLIKGDFQCQTHVQEELMDENEDYLTLERLDRNFYDYEQSLDSLSLTLMRDDKNLVKAWIRKFKSQDYLTIAEKKIRNQYCSALLDMLRHGDIEEPFSTHPDDLPTLPPLPSQYLSASSFPEPRLPDWLERINQESGDCEQIEFEERKSYRSTSPFTNSTSHRRSSFDSGRRFRRRRSRDSDEETEEDRSERGDAYSGRLSDVLRGAGPDGDLNYLPSLTSSSHVRDRFLGASGKKSGSRTLDNTMSQMQEKELERKADIMQSQFHEEVLKLQDRHKRDLQRLTERKNDEINEIKEEYKMKLKEQEDLSSKFEQKVLAMGMEVRHLKETKEKEREDLRKSFRDSLESKEKEMSAKIEVLVREFEREREALQLSNKRRFQTLLEDTNGRLNEMETHYKTKVQSCESTISDLECRVKEVVDEAERSKQARDILEKANSESTKRIKEISDEFKSLQSQYVELEHQYEQNLQDNTSEIRSLREKHQSQLNFARQERERLEARHEESRKELDTQLEDARRSLRIADESHARDLTERQAEWQMERSRLENTLTNRLTQATSEYDSEVARLKSLIRNAEEETEHKEAESRRLREEMVREKKAMEEAMQDLRQQMEASSHHHLEEMRRQIEHVQTDLTKSKALREKQTKEQGRQLEMEREKHAKELASLREEWSSEKDAIIRQHNYEREKMQMQYGSDITQVRESLQAQLSEVQNRWSEQSDTDSHKIAMMEQTIRSLKEETTKEVQLRKQQLLELGLLREEEKNRLLEEHNKNLEGVRQEHEKKQMNIEKKHADEMEVLLKKTNEKLKEIEGEYNMRAQQAAQTIADLQSCVQQLTSERTKLQAEADRLLSEKERDHSMEKQKLCNEHTSALEALKQAVSTSNNKVGDLQRRLANREEEHEIQLARLRSEHELQTRDLMPSGVQRELEETIHSLKTQISFLNRRIRLMQDDGDEEFDTGDMNDQHIAIPSLITA